MVVLALATFIVLTYVYSESFGCETKTEQEITDAKCRLLQKSNFLVSQTVVFIFLFYSTFAFNHAHKHKSVKIMENILTMKMGASRQLQLFCFFLNASATAIVFGLRKSEYASGTGEYTLKFLTSFTPMVVVGFSWSVMFIAQFVNDNADADVDNVGVSAEDDDDDDDEGLYSSDSDDSDSGSIDLEHPKKQKREKKKKKEVSGAKRSGRATNTTQRNATQRNATQHNTTNN